jgi:phage terminase small subunit
MAELRPQRRLFVREWLTDRNASAAYLRAGYKAKTPEIASAHASRLAADGKVKDAIRFGLAAIDARLDAEADRYVKENDALALSRISDIATWDAEGHVTMGASDTISDAAMAAIKKLTVRRLRKPGDEGIIEERIELELHGKDSPLERALKMVGKLKQDAAPAAHIEIIVGTPGFTAGVESMVAEIVP